MMTIEEMRQYRIETGLSYEEVSRRSGVPFGTVQKVFSGTTRSPRYQTIKALEKVFVNFRRDQLEAQTAPYNRNVSYMAGSFPPSDRVEEPRAVYGSSLAAKDFEDDESTTRDHSNNSPAAEDATGHMGQQRETYPVKDSAYDITYDLVRSSMVDHMKYPRQGEYTIKDYLALPQDQRAELIDGVIFDMSSPSSIHQIILGQLHLIFASFIQSHGGPCQVLLAPMDVALDDNDKTIVEPDVMIICDPDKIRRQRVYGAPDLVVEILSPSTRRKDMTLKMWKYSRAGVREYWIVDPDRRQVIVYDFEHGLHLETYTFQDKVPVGIYDGKLEVDFAQIWKAIKRLY